MDASIRYWTQQFEADPPLPLDADEVAIFVALMGRLMPPKRRRATGGQAAA